MDFNRSPEDNTSVIKMLGELDSFLGYSNKPPPRSKRKLNSSHSAAGSFLSGCSSAQKKLSIAEEYTTLTRNEKADLIVAKSKVAKMEDEIHCILSEKKQKEIEIENLTKRHSSSLLKLQEECDSLRRQFKVVVEQKQMTVEELEELNNKYEDLKTVHNSSLKHWNTEKTKLNVKLNKLEVESQNEVSDLKGQHLRQDGQVELYMNKCEELEMQLKTYYSRQKETAKLLKEFSDVKLRCDLAENKVRELEEKNCRTSESQAIIQNNQAELLRFREMMKENQRLIEDNKLYRDSAENSLILQEKLTTLEAKMKRAEEVIESLNKLEFENKSLKAKLQKWGSSDVCGGTVKPRSPGEMTRIIAELQKTQLSMVEKQGELEASVFIKESILTGKSNECSKLHDLSMDLQAKTEQLEDKCQKLQRRFTLVSADRDGLRRVLASYEDDTPSPAKIHIREAENTIKANLKQIALIENELLSAKQEASTQKTLHLQLQLEHEKLKSANLESPPIIREKLQTEQSKKEVEELTVAMRKLQEEKQFLEIRLKHRECQGDFDPKRSRVLHMPNNPSQIAREKYLRNLEHVHEENEKLRKKLLQLQMQNQEMMDESMNVSKLIKTSKTMEEVTKQLEAEKKSKKRLIEQYGKKAKDFREAVYNLLGYSFKESSTETYRVQSIYAEKQDDFFLFECAKEKDGNLKTVMIETEYAREWSEAINDYLSIGESIPGLLAAVTLELFNRQQK